MTYKQFTPKQPLADYIDAFWTVTGNGRSPVVEKILPDGCVDIIFNLGEDCTTENGTRDIRNGKAYLVGTMTHFKLATIQPQTNLLGVRFKPAAFSAFYRFSPLHQVADTTVEFEQKLLPDLKQILADPIEHLNRFYTARLEKPMHDLLPVIKHIQNDKGQIKVVDLAKQHFMTSRQLERKFSEHIGISPKEFIRFVRYQSVLPVIQNKPSSKSLLEVAFEHGYYDHSHLTNEMKRYTGIAPSQL